METVFIGVSRLTGFLRFPATSWGRLYHKTEEPRYRETSGNTRNRAATPMNEARAGFLRPLTIPVKSKGPESSVVGQVAEPDQPWRRQVRRLFRLELQSSTCSVSVTT